MRSRRDAVIRGIDASAGRRMPARGHCVPPAAGAPRRPFERNWLAFACALLMAYGTTPGIAQQLPTGGSVAAGTATIAAPSAGTLNINQSTNQAIINWQTFSVGQGGTVNFNQPGAASSTFNRVLSSTPSSIAGTINAPGTVLLVNPNGIAITRSGVINTGGFAASTLDMKDSDYLAGKYKFTGAGASAAVTNAGRINVSDGGFAALLGGQVSNSGVISARLGRVALGAGELATLDFGGDGFLSVGVPSSQLGKLVDPSGALVTNSGRIRAKGGQVFLSAATAANILRDAVNVPGSISARSVGTRNGRIVIGGGPGGRVSVTGKLAANGGRRHAGGSIAISGASVNLAGQVAANGRTGGSVTAQADQDLTVTGTVAAKGRDGQGGGISLTGADVTLLGALIDASAAGAGSTGGHIAIIAGDTASISGTILAEGGDGGHGGLVETSGEHLHVADGTRVSTLARNGIAGTWLIDPNDFTIAASGGDISGATLSANLAGGDVVILSSSGVTAGNGDIFVNDAVSWSSAHALTLSAVRNIDVNASIIINGTGSLGLLAGGALAINSTISVTGAGSVSLAAAYDTTTVPGVPLLELAFGNGASIDYGPVNNGGALTINGAAYTLLYSMSDVQGINASNAAAQGNYALATSLNASATANWLPLGLHVGAGGIVSVLNSNNGFTGTFEGLGHTISNLTVVVDSNAGLFGWLGGTVRDVGVVGGSVTGSEWVGGLVGRSGGIVVNAYSSSAIIGVNFPQDVGGLIGAMDGGVVINSHASGNVTAPDGQYIGGLIGTTNVGTTVINTYATGNVGGVFAVGGLIGDSFDAVINSYATGNVTGEQFVGGLIGYVEPTGSVTRTFATGSVTGDANSIGLGGLIGYNNGTSVTDSYATGAVIGGDQLGGLFGVNVSVATNVYATGFVGAAAGATPTEMGALVGENDFTVTSGYWNSQTSGQTSAIGVDAGVSTTFSQTTAQLQGALPGGFGNAVWGTGPGLYPYLLWKYPTTPQAISGFAYQDSGVTALASGANGPAYVSAQVDGASLGSVTTGANGYYYIVAPAGTISGGGSAVLAYTALDANTGATNAARVTTATGSVGGFDIWGNTLIAPTSFTSYSAASATSLQSQDATLIATAVGSNTAVSTLVSGLANYGYVATGSGFTIDQPLNLSNGLYVQTTASNADITVAQPLTLPDKNGLSLLASGNIQFQADVTITGGGAVALATGGDYALNGHSITFTGGAGAGASLSINGDAYTLLYDMAGVQGINTGLGGLYAVALSLDASGPPTWVPIGTDGLGNVGNGGNGFAGTFAGLGHAITDLAVNIGAHNDAGLFGYSSGTIRDVGMFGAEINGRQNVGALVGSNSGLIKFSYATVDPCGCGEVDGTGNVGGLVGQNLGQILRSHADVAVFGSGNRVGGLIGDNSGAVTESYATGDVRGATSVGGLIGRNEAGGVLARVYATGLVDGNLHSTELGGLIGRNDGSVTDAYATGAVAGGDFVGGLVGRNSATGSVTNAYAAGFVTLAHGATGTHVGALVGVNPGVVSNGVAVTGPLAALPAGFDPAVWGIVPNISYPYFNWRFPTGPTVVSGNATGIANGDAGLLVGLAIDGTVASYTATNANGYYQFMVDPAAPGSAALTWLTTDRFPTGSIKPFSNAVAELGASAPGFAQGLATGLNLAPNRVLVLADSNFTTLSGVLGLMERALYGPTNSTAVFTQVDPNLIRFDVCGCLDTIFAPNTSFRLQSSASALTFDVPLGDPFALPTNIRVVGAGSLAIDDAVTALRHVRMTAPGDISIGPLGSVTAGGGGNAIVLAAGGSFINDGGAGALDLANPNGRWLIYSSTPAGDNFGNLDSANTAIWNSTYATLRPANVTATGNRYVFALQPTLTFTSTGALTKNSGDDATAAVAASPFAVSGLQGVPNAFLADTAAMVYGGAPALTSAGAPAAAGIAGSPYRIDIANGTLTSLDGYAFAFASSGTLTINAPSGNPTSQVVPPNNNPTPPGVNIMFQNPNTGPINIALTTPGNITANPPPGTPTNVTTTALTSGPPNATNNGLVFTPISQYDPDQYSQFTLPGYQDQAGEATIFTIIARAIAADHAADYLIDGFWTGAAADWTGANANNPLAGKVTFSDGAGHDVAPTDANAFPIAAGTTDIAALLKSGPVMIGDGQTPAHWLLATGLTNDGKGIIADDAISGQQVVLSYNPDTRTVGGITSVYDAKTKGFVALADAGGDMPAGSGGPAALQAFVPATFFAVTIGR